MKRPPAGLAAVARTVARTAALPLGRLRQAYGRIPRGGLALALDGVEAVSGCDIVACELQRQVVRMEPPCAAWQGSGVNSHGCRHDAL
jgi:hypothetical protein